MVGIILAAGLGSRCSEITKETHKALIEIKGRPNIENNIEFLLEQGVDKVYIIVGYLKEQFNYLPEKYDKVVLVENPKFREYNNIYSMYCALPYFDEGIIVVEADVVIHQHFKLPIEGKKALYTTMLREEVGKEWVPRLNKEGYIQSVDITEERSPSFIGITYYSPEDAKMIKEEYKNYINEEMDPEKLSLYWDDVVYGILEQLKIEVYEIPPKSATEIDNYANYLDALKIAEE